MPRLLPAIRARSNLAGSICSKIHSSGGEGKALQKADRLALGLELIQQIGFQPATHQTEEIKFTGGLRVELSMTSCVLGERPICTAGTVLARLQDESQVLLCGVGTFQNGGMKRQHLLR